MALLRISNRCKLFSTSKWSRSQHSINKHDFIIVGGGTAGCLLANRLSADPRNSVLLLEAGSDDSFLPIHIPLGYLLTMDHPRTSWQFSTTNQKGLNNRNISYPRGKVLGGCSSINGMIYQRGQKDDFDNLWSSAAGGQGWDWNDVCKYYNTDLHYAYDKESNNNDFGKNWRVEKQRLHWDILDTWLNAADEIGIPPIKHFNNSNEISCGYYQVNQNSGVRLSSFRAFLKPILKKRKNLSVITNAMIKRIVTNATQINEDENPNPNKDENNRQFSKISGISGISDIDSVLSVYQNKNEKTIVAKGVEYWNKNSELCYAYANKSIILSAGAIGSPHILQCSGIGNASELSTKQISPIVDLPGVGENLQDHLQIRCVYKLKNATTLNTQSATPWGKLRIGLQYIFNQSGPLSMAPSQLGAFAISSDDVQTPDLQWHVQPLSLPSWNDPLDKFDGITCTFS